MKKLVALLAVSAMAFGVFAASLKEGVDVELPATTQFVLDDFEDGMYFIAARDSWNQFGNIYGVQQFSDAESTKARWDGNGNCGVFHYIDLPGNKIQGCIYECQDLQETNLKDYGYLSIVVNNPNDYPVSLQLFTKSGSWTWGNSKEAFTIEPGVHTVLYKIGVPVISVPSKVQTMGFAFYTEGAHPAGEIYVDDIILYTKK